MKHAFFVSVILGASLIGLTAFQPERREDLTREELGRLLFEDKELSADRSISCASCHIPAFAFGDTAAVSLGVGGQKGTRNTPAITNMSFRSSFFWDGRAASLEEQVLRPIENPIEMALPLSEAVARLRANARYAGYFQTLYGRAPDTTTLADALAAFIRTLETADTPFDRWMRGDEQAMSAAAVRGRTIFMNKGKCFDCHFGPDFTGDEFRNIGLFNGKDLNDPGRFAVTQDSADLGRFKVPGLRNVAVSAPYMHDGSFRTLREVIDYYDNPDRFVPNSIGRDTLLARPLGLTDAEKDDLEAFLRALTDDRFARKP
ncbi:MAG: cytochrome c peroxidase [Saprospiraceae bacterium]|nr:cytochrome-c peroxidase [Saprospiraceae bacterium]MDW8228749.1 cytochrome c peroxidase [Saprospiraceae bacterium]